MKSLWKNVEGVDDRREEEPGLYHDVPYLIEIAIPQEEDARGQRETGDDSDQGSTIKREGEERRRTWRLSDTGQEDRHHF